MKKIVLTIFITVLIILISNVVFADMSAPIIKAYEAYISKVDGAHYYATDNEGNIYSCGKLDYGTQIKIQYEYEFIDGNIYGGFELKENDSRYYMILIQDIKVLDESTDFIKDINFNNPINIKILANEGVKIHEGPAYAYSTIETIQKNTELVGYRAEMFSENPWYYIDYNGVSGWICELNGTIGYASEEINKLLTSIETKVYSESDRESVVGTIPANTYITDLMLVDQWSESYYINYNGISGYVERTEIGSYWKSEWEVQIEGINIYKTGDLNSEILIENIPIGTILDYEYSTEIKANGWIYTTYNEVSGWAFVFDEIEYGPNYIQDLDENETILEENIVEDSMDLEEEIEETLEIENTTVFQSDNEVEAFNTVPGTQFVILSIFVAATVSITIIVIMVLINKKKNNNKEEK